MNVPLSWLKDFVDIDLSLDEIAHVLTMAGLEVDEVQLRGLDGPANNKHGFKFTGLTWPEDKFVVAEIREVNAHPDADRLVLCQLEDGTGEHTILTGAPNLYPYKGQGRLDPPLKVPYVREGAILYDGHKPGFELTKLKKTKIRGFETRSMVCSMKELGLSEEHEGIMLLDSDAPTGMPLKDYIGDAVFVIDILPNMARNACISGVAREVAAQLNIPLKQPRVEVQPQGAPIDGMAEIVIEDAELNPRFVLGYVEGITVQPSPQWVQLRLEAAGMRPINSVVDATNYVMLETGQPLHSFDYQTLKARSLEGIPTIITRHAHEGEMLLTLDKIERKLDPSMMLVTDQSGPLSIGGIMGGFESEIMPSTDSVLLESAIWNFINIRKTSSTLKLNSEAGYRNSRGVHPEIAIKACRECLEKICAWSGGRIAPGLIDNYAKVTIDTVNEITTDDIKRSLGLELSLEKAAEYLRRLEFECTLQDNGKTLRVKTPQHRLDIGTGLIGKADLMEEIARLHGYDNIPMTRMADELPPAYANRMIAFENAVCAKMVKSGFYEIINYRMTSPEREARLLGKAAEQYVTLANPISPDRAVMRSDLMPGVMEIVEKNIRLADALRLFEIGPIFLPQAGEQLPNEQVHLAAAITGKRNPSFWSGSNRDNMDFFDLKGVLEQLFSELHTPEVAFKAGGPEFLHPGKSASIAIGEVELGYLGELHPALMQHYDLLQAPVLLMDLNLDALLPLAVKDFKVKQISQFPAVLEDIAIVIDETVPNEEIEAVIRQAGGKLLADCTLFDIFRNDQIGAGKKSMAYALTYQSNEKTLNEKDANAIRNKIIKRLEQVLNAKLRS